MGASQQDIDHIEEEIMFKAPNRSNKNSYSYAQNFRHSRVSGPDGNPNRNQRYQDNESEDYGYEANENG